MIFCKEGKTPLSQFALFALAAAGMLATPSAVMAACEDIARVPLVAAEAVPGKDGAQGVICLWQTEKAWLPPEACGNKGFEVVGWGERPAEVEFKRRNTYYAKKWKTQDAEPDGADSPAWTSATLDKESLGNRCFTGWCKPVNYQLRTAEPVSEDICGQTVELRIKLTDEVK
jgi:hypothetical protein